MKQNNNKKYNSANKQTNKQTQTYKLHPQSSQHLLCLSNIHCFVVDILQLTSGFASQYDIKISLDT